MGNISVICSPRCMCDEAGSVNERNIVLCLHTADILYACVLLKAQCRRASVQDVTAAARYGTLAGDAPDATAGVPLGPALTGPEGR